MWLSRSLSTLLHIIAVWHISFAATGRFSLKKSGYSLSNSFLASNSLGSLSMLSDARCAYSCETNTLCKGFQFSDALKICNKFDTLPSYTDFVVSQATDIVYYKKNADGTGITTTVSTTTTMTSTTTTYDPSLKNYWAFDSNIATDSVGGAHATATNGCSLTTDRCGQANSALSLANSYLTLPQGVYFAGDFTITFWFKTGTSVGSWSRIFNFSVGQQMDSVYIIISSSGSKPEIGVFNAGLYTYIQGTSSLLTTKWTFIAGTFSGTTLTFYIDGVQVSQHTTSKVARNVVRTTCYIGKSDNPADGYSNSFFDELKIYNRCLTPSEILTANNTACA